MTLFRMVSLPLPEQAYTNYTSHQTIRYNHIDECYDYGWKPTGLPTTTVWCLQLDTLYRAQQVKVLRCQHNRCISALTTY